MKKIIYVLIALMAVVLAFGCAQKHVSAPASLSARTANASESGKAEVRPDRMMIWKARLHIQVLDVNDAVAEAYALTERQGGFVERKSDEGEQSADLTIRIPAESFQTAISSLEALGKVTRRNVEGEDVTEQYIDVEAKLKNNIALRDRLKQLLEKAVNVKDILAIEAELNRVQTDIDSLEGRIKSLKGQVDYATVNLHLKRKPIPGPLGCLFKGLWWGIEKLFVIRD
jgi:hypothetical protein